MDARLLKSGESKKRQKQTIDRLYECPKGCGRIGVSVHLSSKLRDNVSNGYRPNCPECKKAMDDISPPPPEVAEAE